MLITCKSCQASISKDAYNCPQCGHPNRETATNNFFSIVGWLFVIFVVAPAIFFGALFVLIAVIAGTSR